MLIKVEQNGENQWYEPNPPRQGDIAIVNIPVQVYFKIDTIVDEWDEEGNTLESHQGFVMEVLPQTIVYKGESIKLIANIFKNE